MPYCARVLTLLIWSGLRLGWVGKVISHRWRWGRSIVCRIDGAGASIVRRVESRLPLLLRLILVPLNKERDYQAHGAV